MLTDTYLSEIEARANAATDGNNVNIFSFVFATQDIPALVAEVRRLRAELGKVKELRFVSVPSAKRTIRKGVPQ